MITQQYLKDVGSNEDPCWVPCAAGDPGATLFIDHDALIDALAVELGKDALGPGSFTRSAPSYKAHWQRRAKDAVRRALIAD